MKKIMKRAMSLCIAAAAVVSLVPCTANADANIEIGEYVQMGAYYGQPILWRCVDVDDNNILMLSDKILCIKAFDAEASVNLVTGSHSVNKDRQESESNYWGDSNLRSWLNSDEAAGKVKWVCGNPPIKEKLWNNCNAYDQEAGFLSGFTAKEKLAIKPVKQKSLLAYPEYRRGLAQTGQEQHEYSHLIDSVVKNYSVAYADFTEDKMFLLDVKQINNVYNKSNIFGDDYYIGEPTAQCVKNSEYKDSDLAVGKKWHSWLRSPYADSVVRVRYVNSSGSIYSGRAFINDTGVRPAFYLDTSFDFKAGSGTQTDPYIYEHREVIPEPDISEPDISEPDISEPDIPMSYDNGVLTIKAKEAGEAYLYTAYFDEKDIFTGCCIQTVILKEGTNTVDINGVDVGLKAKLMLWDENMQPIYKYIIIE